jgi:hypothetical protein
MADFVTSLGFQLSGFFLANVDAYLRLMETDVVFVKSPGPRQPAIDQSKQDPQAARGA